MDHMDTFNSSNLSIGSTTCFHVTICFICQYNRRFAEALRVATFSTWSKGTRKFIRHSESELEPSTEPSNSLPGKAWHCENVWKCVKSWPSTRSSTGLELQFFESPDGEDKHSVNIRGEIIDQKLWRSLVVLIHVDPCWSLIDTWVPFCVPLLLYYPLLLVHTGDRVGLLWFAMPVLHASRELFQPGCKMQQGSQTPNSDCAVRGPRFIHVFQHQSMASPTTWGTVATHIHQCQSKAGDVHPCVYITVYIADIANILCIVCPRYALGSITEILRCHVNQLIATDWHLEPLFSIFWGQTLRTSQISGYKCWFV